MLKVRYGDGQYLSLDFFVTEPLETLIKKRAAFLVTHEQWNDPKRWYNGLYSQWDMKHQILRSPDDLDGLQSYAVACDDTALGKAPYLAAKNIFFPEQKEVDSIEKLHPQLRVGRPAADRERALSLRRLRHSELESQSREPGRRPSRQETCLADLRLSPCDAALLQHVCDRKRLSRDGSLSG